MNKIIRIKQLLEDKGVTRQKVAQRCEVSYSALSKDLTNQPVKRLTDDKLDKIIRYLEAVNTNEV